MHSLMTDKKDSYFQFVHNFKLNGPPFFCKFIMEFLMHKNLAYNLVFCFHLPKACLVFALKSMNSPNTDAMPPFNGRLSLVSSAPSFSAECFGRLGPSSIQIRLQEETFFCVYKTTFLNTNTRINPPYHSLSQRESFSLFTTTSNPYTPLSLG